MTEGPPVRRAIRWLAAGAGLAAASYATYVGISFCRYGRVTPSSSDVVDALLDQCMSAYEVAVRDEVHVAAPAEIAFMAASRLDIQRLALVRAIFKARAVLLGGDTEEVGLPRQLLAWMKTLGWVVLAEIPGRAVILGNVTRPWEASAAPRVVQPPEFAAFAERGYVKIVTTWAAESIGPHECRLTLRTRVATTDATARRRFRRYWAVFSPGSLLIRYMALGVVKGQVERQAREAALLTKRT